MILGLCQQSVKKQSFFAGCSNLPTAVPQPQPGDVSIKYSPKDDFAFRGTRTLWSVDRFYFIKAETFLTNASGSGSGLPSVSKASP